MKPEKEWQYALKLRIIEAEAEKIILDTIWSCDVDKLK